MEPSPDKAQLMYEPRWLFCRQSVLETIRPEGSPWTRPAHWSLSAKCDGNNPPGGVHPGTLGALESVGKACWKQSTRRVPPGHAQRIRICRQSVSETIHPEGPHPDTLSALEFVFGNDPHGWTPPGHAQHIRICRQSVLETIHPDGPPRTRPAHCGAPSEARCDV